MIRIRSRIRQRISRGGEIIIERKFLGRIINGIIILVLLAAVIIPVASGEHISGVGALLFAIVFIVCLYNAGANKQYRISRENERFEYRFSFMGILLKQMLYPINSLEAVRLRSVQFNIHNPKRENPGLYKLELVFKAGAQLPGLTGRKMFLEDSSDSAELTATGKALAAYANIAFETDVVGTI